MNARILSSVLALLAVVGVSTLTAKKLELPKDSFAMQSLPQKSKVYCLEEADGKCVKEIFYEYGKEPNLEDKGYLVMNCVAPTNGTCQAGMSIKVGKETKSPLCMAKSGSICEAKAGIPHTEVKSIPHKELRQEVVETIDELRQKVKHNERILKKQGHK